ncbi:uncharacterized protein [Procambarus clarkii]|uniref:uncharacterized protein n=1 Tax=Procambarus clarkii TaxID=6728 RepID=UPI0037445782
MFLNENDLYEIRLNTHWEWVDKFIVIEAGETHTGLKKPFNFDKERFERYSEKLIYVTFDSFEDEMAKYPQLLDYTATVDRGPNMASKDWTRDHFQFNYIVKVLSDVGARPEDQVYISCLDELVKPDAISAVLPLFSDNQTYNGFRPLVNFRYTLYAYKLNLLHKTWENHYAGLFTEVGNFDKMLPATIRDRDFKTHHPVENAGWHFTFLDKTDGEMVLEKQRSWAHSRDVYPGQKTKFDNSTKEEALERFFSDYSVTVVDITKDTHPPYVVDNLDKFQEFIFKK